MNDIEIFLADRKVAISSYAVEVSSYGRSLSYVGEKGLECSVIIEDEDFASRLMDYLVENGATVERLPEPGRKD